MAQYVLAPGCVVKYPVGKTGTVKAKGPVCPRGGTAIGSYFGELSPSAVPTDHKAFAAPEVIDLANEHKGLLNNGPALRGQVGRQGP